MSLGEGIAYGCFWIALAAIIVLGGCEYRFVESEPVKLDDPVAEQIHACSEMYFTEQDDCLRRVEVLNE